MSATVETRPPTVVLRPHLSATQRARRRLTFTAVFLLVSGSGILLFADFLWRTELFGLKYLLLALHGILFAHISFGFCTALFGFFARRTNDRTARLTATLEGESSPTPVDAPTAILFPIYNESVDEVFANVRATYRSLERSGQLEAFDLFILSDSRDPDKWVDEEVAWQRLCREFGAFGRIHYRHRRENTNKKAGNISDFLQHWGKRYRYMVIFDADSLMSGATLVTLVRLMEKNPQVGLIQTAPALKGGSTFYARLQQFANRLYSRIFIAGLNWWQLSEGNYWGHNAIIRVQPFMEYCELPTLPWREPIGGKILSHDFVEAALMRQGGYEVWLAYDLEDSYEDGPPALDESLARDRRWCQGNLQHAWLLFARGFSGINRLHFLNGILAYLSSFLWFCFLLTATLVVVNFARSGLSLIAVSGFTRPLGLSIEAHGALILGLTGLVLYLPKTLALVDLALTPERCAAFGGLRSAARSILCETFCSALLAPVMMIQHTLLLGSILLGAKVDWGTQRRSGGGVNIVAIVLEYLPLSALALAWGSVAWVFNPNFFWWLSPVLLGLLLSPLFVSLLASENLGQSLRRRGYFLTPEETAPIREVRELPDDRKAMERAFQRFHHRGAALAVADPFINAIHVTLERRDTGKRPPEMDRTEAIDRLLSKGLESLPRADLLRYFTDPHLMEASHRELWQRPTSRLAESWQRVLAGYRA